MWYHFCMDIQRTITIIIEPDPDLERTLEAFRAVQQALSEPCYNDGKPLGALALQRRLSLWQHGALRQAAINKAEVHGLSVAKVDPRYTSKTCSRCGLRGKRRRHVFSCPHCGLTLHADINAARNIRNRYTVFRDGGDSSMSLEAQTATVVGKSLTITSWGN